MMRGKYAGLNDQHFTEKLTEVEGIVLSRPTVRRILRQAGIGAARRRRPPRHRRRRERKARAGLMILWDGSRHAWLEDRGPMLYLMGAVDDATSDCCQGRTSSSRSARPGTCGCCSPWRRTRGCP
jgi:hypothetical protein